MLFHHANVPLKVFPILFKVHSAHCVWNVFPQDQHLLKLAQCAGYDSYLLDFSYLLGSEPECCVSNRSAVQLGLLRSTVVSFKTRKELLANHSHPVKTDLNKKWLPKQKTIQNCNIGTG